MKWIDDVGEILISENDEWVWMVPEVYVYKEQCCLTSAWFSFAEETWRLVIMPGYEEDFHKRDSCDIFLFLWRKNTRPPCHVYSVDLGVKNAKDGTTLDCRRKIETDSYYGFGAPFYVVKEYTVRCGLMKVFCLIKKKKDIPNDRLVSNGEIVDIENKSGVVIAEKDVKVEAKGVERLTQDFKSLLHEKWSSDVILKTNDREFHVHRMILWARSRVFASMFEHDMAEKTSGVVDIPDCTGEAFEVFLQYLYTGSADTMSPDNVLNLYYTADKYRVDDLKAECVEYMKRTLSLDTICGVISLSLRHNDLGLLEAASHFFCRNVKQIIKTVQWQKYMSENPIHANELYIKAINA